MTRVRLVSICKKNCDCCHSVTLQVIGSLNKKEEEGYSETITTIHEEFRTAGDRLYIEAKQIIDSIKILNEDKVNRLKSLGFTASKEVKEAENILSKRKISEERLKDIEYYREQYPLQKFITEDQVKEICRKYGLIYHRIGAYTGFVPESKLQLMEAFELKQKDARYSARIGFGSRVDASYEDYMSHKNMKMTDYYSIDADREFLIAAPAKDFNISSREMIQDFKVVTKPIPDPVVLAPVRGGYLVVAAWGTEASDPIVVNDINN
jgi:hypothetical protein